MSLYRFYVEGCSEASDKIYISGKDYNHIKNVLRLRIGEEIIVSDGTSRDYHCRISDYPEEMVEAEIIDINDNATELPAKIILFQGMPKADKFEHIIQKTVELGVHEIYPVMMKRCVVKLESGGSGKSSGSGKEAKKLQRFNKVAEAAAKQSQRGIIPEVKSFISFRDAVDMAASMDMMLIPYESACGMDYSREIINSIRELCHKSKNSSLLISEEQNGQNSTEQDLPEDTTKPTVGIFIGPEGGFAPEEIEYAKEKGGVIISLGNRILRTETAGPAIMSILGFALDD